MAIVDVDNMMTQPKGLTSASGIDVMTHAIEAYVSIMATDYTDGLALKAAKAVFEYLPRAYDNGANDPEAREKMGKRILYGRNGICKRISWTEPLHGT